MLVCSPKCCAIGPLAWPIEALRVLGVGLVTAGLAVVVGGHRVTLCALLATHRAAGEVFHQQPVDEDISAANFAQGRCARRSNRGKEYS